MATGLGLGRVGIGLGSFGGGVFVCTRYRFPSLKSQVMTWEVNVEMSPVRLKGWGPWGYRDNKAGDVCTVVVYMSKVR